MVLYTKLMNKVVSDTKQAGVVSIITVLMFAILTSVVSAGFMRLMLQEQQDTLRDDLNKGAYNAAQAGVEDAKRAIQYCLKNPVATATIDCGGDGSTNGLYSPTCPGFNAPTLTATNGAFVGLGIDKPAADGTRVGESSVNMRYTCTIISKTTDIVTVIGGPHTETNTAMFELSSSTPFDTIEVTWIDRLLGAADLPTKAQINPASAINPGNIRFPDWRGTTYSYPSLLRGMVIVTDPANVSVASTKKKTFFAYPTSDATVAEGTVDFSTTSTTLANDTYMTLCTVTSSLCTLKINVTGQPTKRYLVLQLLYKDALVFIKAFNGVTPVALNGDQTVIDSTGAAGNQVRRVQVRVSPGDPVATGTALDTGVGVCKDFFVNADGYTDSCSN